MSRLIGQMKNDVLNFLSDQKKLRLDDFLLVFQFISVGDAEQCLHMMFWLMMKCFFLTSNYRR